MRNEHFNELMASIEEAGKIQREEVKASRVTEFPEQDVKAIRDNTRSRVIGTRQGQPEFL